MATASSSVRGLRSRSSLGRRPLCGPCSKRETKAVSAPYCLMFSLTCASKPVIRAATNMITLTPSTTPNTVRKLRSLCARRVSIACFRFSPCCCAIVVFSDPAPCGRSQRSSAVRPQRFDRIKFCRARGGINSEKEADCRGNTERENNGAHRRAHGNRRGGASCGNHGIRQHNSGQSTGRGQDSRFGYELQQNVFLFCAKRAAQTDLASAFGDAGEHDVHDDDTADHKEYGGEANGDHEDVSRQLFKEAHDGIRADDSEAVRGVPGLMAPGAQ